MATHTELGAAALGTGGDRADEHLGRRLGAGRKALPGGHDRPELYAVQLPRGETVLGHVGTIAIETAGQAIDWDKFETGTLYGIDRGGSTILEMTVAVGGSAKR